MSTALALRLIASGAVAATDAESALLASVVRRVPFVRALLDTGAIGEHALEQLLDRWGGLGLRQVVGIPELVNRLPPHFCRRFGALPVRVDAQARVVEVASADPVDLHLAQETAFHLGVPVRLVRASLAAIEEAIRRIELEGEPGDTRAGPSARVRRATPPFPHGAPESTNPPPTTSADDSARSAVAPAAEPRFRETLRPGAATPEDAGAAARGDGAPRPDLDWTDPPNRPPPSERAADVNLPGEAAPEPQVPPELRAPLPPPLPALPPPPPSSRQGGSSSTLDPAGWLVARGPIVDERAREELRGPSNPAAPALDARASAGRTAAVEPPAVSFPSLPPPSISEPTALLPADPWFGPPVAIRAEPPPNARRRSGSRPAIDVELPLPPSERTARDQRANWDVTLVTSAPEEPTNAPRSPSADAAEADEDAGEDPPILLDSLPEDAEILPEEAAPTEPHRATAGPPPLPQEPPGTGIDPTPVLHALREAVSRDEVLAAALRGLRLIGRKAAIFVVRRDGFHGWACNVELGDPGRIREVVVPIAVPSLFASALLAGTYFGPVPATPAHAALLALLEHDGASGSPRSRAAPGTKDGAGSDVVAATVRAAGKAVIVLFADDLVDVRRKVLGRVQEIADAAGDALSRILSSRTSG